MTKNDYIAIRVKNLRKTFKLPHEKHTSVKSLVLRGFRKRKSYELQKALEDINFEVKKGEFFGIVGRNGSGKSTLLKCIAGVYAPTKGGITVNGTLVPFIELGVGFNPELSGRDNVFLNGALLGFNRKQMEDMYDEIVEFAELEKFMDQKLKNYSSGMQVRLAFSIAIRARGDILLLDEVLAVGDSAFQQKCYNFFEKLKLKQQTIILVTHNMDVVKRFCDYALLLEDGVIKEIGKPDEIADQYTIDNIRGAKTDETIKTKNSSAKILTAKLNTKEFSRSQKLILDVGYKLKEQIEVVLGIAIIKDGRSIAEINSKGTTLNNTPQKTHPATLKINLDSFNPGLYSVNVSIFNSENMEMLDYKLQVEEFVIKGNDQTRGGPLYLEGKWTQ